MTYAYPDHDRAEVADLIPRRARRLLDVGCAWGGFGAGLKRELPHLEVHGIEPDPVAAESSRRRLDRVVVGYFPNAVPDERYDVVCFLDVLEHFDNPWRALEQTKALLAEGGVVVASIPNVRHWRVSVPLLQQGRWEYTDEGILDRTHLRFFTRSSMIDLFRSTGYGIEVLEPVTSESPPLSKLGTLLRLLSTRTREELCTIQYGVRAKLVAADE